MVRRHAIIGLMKIGGAEAVYWLGEALLDDVDPRNRQLAAVTMAGIGGARSIEMLRLASSDLDPRVRAAVAASLTRLQASPSAQ